MIFQSCTHTPFCTGYIYLDISLITGSCDFSVDIRSSKIFVLVIMGLDSGCGETSCEETDTGTAAKVPREDTKDTNEKQTAEIQLFPDEGCKQVYDIL
jgi:hypothetical protein